MKKLTIINLIIVSAIILFTAPACKKEKFTSLPVLATTSISTLADSYAESKSKVVSDGGADITARGVCWSINPDPSVANTKTVDDGGIGTYFSKIEGLTAGTLYHLRAYATNAIGTAYSEEITFSTKATLPTLSTTPVSGIATSSAMSGGNITYDGGGTITARGVCWGTTVNPTTSNLKTTDGNGPGVFTSKIEGLTSGTVYHLRAYATNLLGTAYGADITFSTSAVLPTIITSPVSAVTSSTATSGGSVSSDGGASVTARGVCWSANANPTTSDAKTSDGNGSGQFVSSVTALSAGATYHLRAYATNSAGTAYGADITFITSGQVPASVSQQATNLSITGATLNGVVNANNLSTTVTFEYGLSTSYGMTVAAAQSPVTGNSITNVSADITGLTQGTTYHFRVKTVNSLGTVYSGDMTFVTPNFATLNTVIMSAITSVSATSGGNIITDGGAPVNARGVCWNTSGNPTVTDNKSSDGAGTGSYVSQLSGLIPNTTYYVRSYATNSLGTSYGNQISFLTPAAIPTLSTAAITAITSSAATGGGTITGDGGALITARGICWSSTPNPTTAGTKTMNGSGTGSFTGNLTSLNPNTTYYVRAYATNSAGTAYGNEITFTTLAVLPTLTTSVASAITQTTATSGGTVSSDGGAAVTERGVCWSTLANPTVADSKTTDGAGTGTFASSLTGLLPNTLYYLRAYAVNTIGIAYGNELSFTTINAIAYSNGNDAYWTESSNGFRDVVIGNGDLIFKYNSTEKQYVSGNFILIPNKVSAPNGEIIDKNAYYGYNGGTKDNSKYQWDGQKNGVITAPGSVFDMTNMFVSPLSDGTMTYAQAINANSVNACTTSSNSNVIIDGDPLTLVYPDLAPAAGTYNLWNGEELVSSGVLKNSASSFGANKNEYSSQQQMAFTVNQSYCVSTYGQGWRLPTDIEIGHTVNSYSPAAPTTIDQGYQGTSGQIFTSSRFYYPGYAFYKWYVVISNGAWNNIDQWSKTQFQVRCVYSGK